MAIFNSYVKLPEGILTYCIQSDLCFQPGSTGQLLMLPLSRFRWGSCLPRHGWDSEWLGVGLVSGYPT